MQNLVHSYKPLQYRTWIKVLLSILRDQYLATHLQNTIFEDDILQYLRPYQTFEWHGQKVKLCVLWRESNTQVGIHTNFTRLLYSKDEKSSWRLKSSTQTKLLKVIRDCLKPKMKEMLLIIDCRNIMYLTTCTMRVIVSMVNMFQTSYLPDYIYRGTTTKYQYFKNISFHDFIEITYRTFSVNKCIRCIIEFYAVSLLWVFGRKISFCFSPFDNNVNIINERYYHN